jgi:Uma2 family endonuclease
MKVRVGDDFYYPDIAVSCEPLVTNSYYIEQPVAIIEILSPSTEGRDRLEKRLAYQHLPSLQEYLLVTQEKILIEAYRRSADGWEVETYRDHDILQLKSIDFSISLNELYLQVARVL